MTILMPRQELRLRLADAARPAGTRIEGDCGPAAPVSAPARDKARSLTGFRPDAAHRSAAAIVEVIAEAHPGSADVPT